MWPSRTRSPLVPLPADAVLKYSPASLPCSLAGASPQKPDSLLLGLSHRTLRGPGPVLRAPVSRAQAAPSLTPFWSTPGL